VHRVVVRGQREHARLRVVRANALQRFEPAHARHREVEHEHVGRELGIELTGHLARRSLADHRHFGLRL